MDASRASSRSNSAFVTVTNTCLGAVTVTATDLDRACSWKASAAEWIIRVHDSASLTCLLLSLGLVWYSSWEMTWQHLSSAATMNASRVTTKAAAACQAHARALLPTPGGGGPNHSRRPLVTVRRISTSTHFYQNKHLEAYASKPATRLTLRQLVCDT